MAMPTLTENRDNASANDHLHGPAPACIRGLAALLDMVTVPPVNRLGSEAE